MFRTFATLAFLFTFAACQAEQAPDNEAANGAAREAKQPTTSPTTSEGTSNLAAPPSAPSPAEPAPTPDEARSPAAAVAVVRSYCDAIARKRYGQAYRLWANNGDASGMSEREFAQSFAKYDAFDCSFGTPGPIEGAAGSAYVTVPVTVTGTFARSGGFILRGPVTLRRVNDVPGSTEAQRRWHISNSGLDPRP